MRDIIEYEKMAKLILTEGERETVSATADLLEKSFGHLSGIDTDGVEPLVTVLDVVNVFREDVAVKLTDTETLLSNAPERHGNYYRVPGTLE